MVAHQNIFGICIAMLMNINITMSYKKVCDMNLESISWFFLWIPVVEKKRLQNNFELAYLIFRQLYKEVGIRDQKFCTLGYKNVDRFNLVYKNSLTA